MERCLSFFSVSLIKYTGKATYVGKGLFGPQFQVTGKSERWELERTGHMTSTVMIRRQCINTSMLLFSLSFL